MLGEVSGGLLIVTGMKPLAVIPVYLSTPTHVALLRDCLESMRRTADCDVLLVDDESPLQGSRIIIQRIADEYAASYVRNPENAGFSRTVNVGLRIAHEQRRTAILCNMDIQFLKPGWLEAGETDPAPVVGARLIYPNALVQHGGIYFCSPADEPVLTVNHGYVPISELDPKIHGLVSYSKKQDRIFHSRSLAGRASHHEKSGRLPDGGYEFEKTSRPYDGEILSIKTEDGTARVTPNHKITINWKKTSEQCYCVYLMRRGNDWRVGHTKIHQNGAFGPRLRLDQQKGDAIWILDVYEDKQDALKYENLLAWKHGVPTLQFMISSATGIDQEHLDSIWSSLETRSGALNLLREYGRDESLPFADSGTLVPNNHYGTRGRQRLAISNGAGLLTIAAANLIPGHMTVPTYPGWLDKRGLRPTKSDFEIERNHYTGEVYSLKVIPHEHYVSNGVIVHNSLIHNYFDHLYKFAPASMPEVNRRSEVPVTGALQFIKPEAMDAIGYYDENYRLSYEDVDYTLRIFFAGLKCAMNPEVVAIHHEGMVRMKAQTQKMAQWTAQSQAYLAQKFAGASFNQFVHPIQRSDHVSE